MDNIPILRIDIHDEIGKGRAIGVETDSEGNISGHWDAKRFAQILARVHVRKLLKGTKTSTVELADAFINGLAIRDQ